MAAVDDITGDDAGVRGLATTRARSQGLDGQEHLLPGGLQQQMRKTGQRERQAADCQHDNIR